MDLRQDAVHIELTVPVDLICRHSAKASQPTMRAISWTRDFVSRALASFDRSWESLARKHGWVETWTLTGSDEEAIAGNGSNHGEEYGGKTWGNAGLGKEALARTGLAALSSVKLSKR